MTFHEFVLNLGLKHFPPGEISRFWRLNPLNSEPPERIWGNIIATLVLLDRLRTSLRVPIRLTSTYRNEAYNRSVGGVRLSQHTAFTAVDFTCSKLHKAYFTLLEGRENPAWGIPGHYWSHPRIQVDAIPWKPLPSYGDTYMFKGGIGLYSDFIHLDTRGINTLWSSRTAWRGA